MARAMLTRILLSIVATTMLFEWALGADHNVGAPGGSWDTSTDLQSWASSETFTVGDDLVFSYTLNHDVVEVSKDNYDSCSITSPVSTNTASPTTFKLTNAGSRYFICGTPGHCDQGMKVEIKTIAATSGPPTTTPPSSDSPAPPASTTSPPSSGTHTPPVLTPAKPSSATTMKMSAVSMVGIGLLMMI